MARLIYACRFDLQKSLGVETIIEQYEKWIEQHYSRKFKLNELILHLRASRDFTPFLPQHHHLESKVSSDGDRHVHAINWSFPSDHDPSLIWRNEVRVGLLETNVGLEHAIWLDSNDFLVAPARVEMGSPRIIRQICKNQTVHVGEMQIKATPYEIKPGGVADFVTLLTSLLRRLPIVFFIALFRGW